MKKKLFDINLYADALRQSRVIGIIYLIIVELGAILTCTYYNLNTDKYHIQKIINPISIMEANPILIIGILLFAFIMTLILFGFLNERRACDVIHAFPNTRTSLFLSFFTAIITWLVIGILLSCLTSIIGFKIFCVQRPLIFQTIPAALLFLFASGLYISAVTVLAMSITGTFFSNVLVTALIAGAPRLFLYAFTASLTNNLAILSGQNLPGILPIQNNCIFYTIFKYISDPFNISIIQSGIYSLIIGLLYTVAALLIFRSRRSEIAGKSASNKVLQTIFRLTLSMLICLIPCTVINSELDNNNSIFNTILMYILALAAYFLYELVTTRKVRNLLKSIPALGILVLLNIAFIGGANGIKKAVINTTPAPEDIKSISFINMRYPSEHCSNDFDNYYTKMFSNIRFDNEKIKTIVSAVLKKQLASQYCISSDNTTIYTVGIHLSSRTIYRNLRFNVTQQKVIYRLLRKDEKFIYYQELPDWNESKVYFSAEGSKLSIQEQKSVYEMLRNEVKEIDVEKWYVANAYNNMSSEYTCLPLTVCICNVINGEAYNQSIPLSSLTKKTSNLYLSYFSQYTDDSIIKNICNYKGEKNIKLIVKGFGLKKHERPVNFELLFGSYNFNDYKHTTEFFNQLNDLYEQKRNMPVDVTKPLYYIQYNDGESVKYLYFNTDSDMISDMIPTCAIRYPIEPPTDISTAHS